MRHVGKAQRQLRAGDLVEVRSAAEILQTLDADGALDGLPFMPEMPDFCGRRFRVAARAEKTCVEVSPGRYDIREFQNNDVVFLESLRCTGAHHGGCQRACLLFWKTAWLRQVDAFGDGDSLNPQLHDKTKARLKTQTETGPYVCQSSQLQAATQPMSIRRKVFKCWRDVRTGTRGPLEMLGLLARTIYSKIAFRYFWDRIPKGPNKRTPTKALDLQPGEWVEVKTLEEIVATLDAKGKNRGLQVDNLMAPWCGRRYQVRHRLDRMIMETSGELRDVHNSVILEGTECRCYLVLGGCARRELCYWREIWLKRLSDRPDDADE